MEAKHQVTNAAFLEFRMVNPQSSELLQQGIIAPGYEIMRLKAHTKPGQKEGPPEQLMVGKKPYRGFTGAFIEKAYVGRGTVGEPNIEFTLTDEGAHLFQSITHDNIGNFLAIVLDGQLISAPRINSEISKSGEITGDFTEDEAHELANVQNPLRAPLLLEAPAKWTRRWARRDSQRHQGRHLSARWRSRCSCSAII